MFRNPLPADAAFRAIVRGDKEKQATLSPKLSALVAALVATTTFMSPASATDPSYRNRSAPKGRRGDTRLGKAV
jgi:hypothetical protein